jgi:hypothetical protein
VVAIARITGETAPLLFAAFDNRFWHHGLGEPIAALPLQIFACAIAPYDDWHRRAWAAAEVWGVTRKVCQVSRGKWRLAAARKRGRSMAATRGGPLPAWWPRE